MARRAQPSSIGALFLLACAAGGCAARSATVWDRPTAATARPSGGAVLVMEPLVGGTASPGNVARDFAAIRSTVSARILATVKEAVPSARMAAARGPASAVPPGYAAATGESWITSEELAAASDGYRAGATHLLVPVIVEWRQMRTDDPIGVFTVDGNRVTIMLRLMGLEPPTLAGRVTFSNRARLTLNQPAARLLDARFRDAIRRLVSPP